MENPREIVEKLVLARRSNVIVASEYLGFADDQLRNDRDLVDTIMWKLGFPVDDFPDINAELFRLHDQIQLLIRQNDSDPHDDFPNELRGECMNYFVKLEEVLQDSVSYATWALTVDHLGSSNPYVYRAAVGGAAAILRLNDASSDDAPEYQVTYNDKPTMYALCRGFERLSVLLSSLREHEKEYLRSQDDYPRWVNGGSLQKFPFVHTVPFLDLAEDAQENILARLRGASRLLVGADVDKIRNGFAHPRVSHAELEFLRASLDSIREAVGQLEADGFCRITYSLERLEGDAMLRRKISLANKKGYKYSLHIPSSYSWLQLPYYGDPQYILQSARLKDSAEVLRFVRRVESSFSEMYDGYPSRPVSSPRARRDELKEEIIDID